MTKSRNISSTFSTLMFYPAFNSMQLNVPTTTPSGNMPPKDTMYETILELSTSTYKASEQPFTHLIHRELSTGGHYTSLPPLSNPQ